MNIIKTIKKAVKATVGFVKDIIAMFKASFEVKKAKVKAWHEYKQISNPEYIPALISIITGLLRIFVPIQIISTMVRGTLEGWRGDY